MILSIFCMTPSQLKSLIPLSAVLQHYQVKTSKYQNLYHCPLHDDSNASLLANDRRGIAKCLSQSCFDGEDIFGVIQKLEECDFNQALQKAIQIARMDLPLQEAPTKSHNTFQKEKNALPKQLPKMRPLHEKHIHWLKRRYGAGWKWIQQSFGVKSYHYHLAVPITEESYVFIPLNKQTKINPEGDVVFYKGTCRTAQLFPNTSDWKVKHQNSENILVCEGEKDVMHLEYEFYRLGISDKWSAVTNTNGAGNISENLDLFSNFDPANIRKVVIGYDKDRVGEIANEQVYNKAKNYFGAQSEILIHQFPEEVPKGYDWGNFISERERSLLSVLEK